MRLTPFGLAALLCLGAGSGAGAFERYDAGYGYGFAGEAIGGDHIGAPLTRFPRPNELVPTPWGYGTYGVPTVTGIRQAPTAAPTLIVINAGGAAGRHRGDGAAVTSRGRNGRLAAEAGRGDVRVISATVPRR